MKFTCSITINKPKTEVATLFANPEYLKYYQDGFIRKQHVSGNEGATGAVAKMYYKMGKGEMELTETITANNLPDTFAAQYHHKHTDNTMICTFKALDSANTVCEWKIEYTAFRGIVIYIMKTFMPGIFKKQVQKWLHNFKSFVEQHDSI